MEPTTKFISDLVPLVDHFVPGNVTAIDELPDGYGIAYAATTAGGMSGKPLVNETGAIIAIHGRSDNT